MTVILTISSELEESSISDTVDLGSITPSNSSPTQELYIRHDGVNEITDCELYITRYTGFDYPGDDADEDLDILLGSDWGVDKGAKINMDIGNPTVFTYFKYGSGDVALPKTLLKESIVGGPGTTDGEIPASESAHIKVKVDLPTTPGSARYMAFGLVFAFSSTS
jgi:hypothetical protein